jgi:hypothetical protein
MATRLNRTRVSFVSIVSIPHVRETAILLLLIVRNQKYEVIVASSYITLMPSSLKIGQPFQKLKGSA